MKFSNVDCVLFGIRVDANRYSLIAIPGIAYYRVSCQDCRPCHSQPTASRGEPVQRILQNVAKREEIIDAQDKNAKAAVAGHAYLTSVVSQKELDRGV